MSFWDSKLPAFGTTAQIATLLAGVALAVMAGLWQHNEISRDNQLQFERLVDRVSIEIGRRFRQPLSGLNGAKGMYAANGQVTRSMFKDYVESCDLPNNFPGVRGFGFIQRVNRSQLESFVAAERADGAPNFILHQLPTNDNEDYFVIKFIEPAANNVGAQWFDIGSEKLRRAAAEQVIDSGKPTLSAPICGRSLKVL